jgi:hypothetical protein
MIASRLSWLVPAVCLFVPAAALPAASPGVLTSSNVFLEYDAASGDLALRVGLGGEEWRDIEIIGPDGKILFAAKGQGPLSRLGLANLSFTGVAAPLDKVPLEHLFQAFPEGRYDFVGTTSLGLLVNGHDQLNHIVPAAPVIEVSTEGGVVTVSWTPVTEVAQGFPEEAVTITGYRVLGEKGFAASLPPTATSLTLPSQVADFLGTGSHKIQVMAIEKGGNRTVGTASFTLP